MPSRQPIGIFDSGIGGLTVARALRKMMPRENLIYYGDTMHLPYGEKSPETIQRYSREIADFLLKKEVKLIVIACNSASATAFETTREFVGGRAGVLNVIDPMCDLVSQNYSGKRVGVIGTKATIGSGIYQHKLKDQVALSAMATPLLAAMIEEGFVGDHVSKTVLDAYLSRPPLKNLEALILGCTHYPMLQEDLNRYFENRTDVLDASEAVAKATQSYLETHDLKNPSSQPGDTRFYVSDYTEFFERMARFFFGAEIHLEEAKQS
jgi:glutamate racemase